MQAILDQSRRRNAAPRPAPGAALLVAACLLLPLAAARVIARPASPSSTLTPPIPSAATALASPRLGPILEETALIRLPARKRALPEVRTAGAPPQPPAGAAELTARGKQIVWGKTVQGLQAGIRFTEDRRAYYVGTHLGFEVFVRNVGNKPTTFTSRSSPQFAHSSPITPTVQEEKGDAISALSFQALQFQTRTTTLQPGESVQVSHSQLALDFTEGTSESGIGIEPGVPVTPGTYHLRQDVRLKPEGGQAETLALTSGDLVFTAISSVRNAVWGEAQHGLQTGASFTEGRKRYEIGETVPMDLYFRNATSKPLAVCFARFHDFDHVPEVVNETGERLAVRQIAPLLYPSKETVLLQPGATVFFGHASLVLTRLPSKEPGTYPEVAVAPGKYRIRLYGMVQPDGGQPPALLPGKQGAGKVGEVASVPEGTTPRSGDLELEVAEPPAQ